MLGWWLSQPQHTTQLRTIGTQTIGTLCRVKRPLVHMKLFKLFPQSKRQGSSHLNSTATANGTILIAHLYRAALSPLLVSANLSGSNNLTFETPVVPRSIPVYRDSISEPRPNIPTTGSETRASWPSFLTRAVQPTHPRPVRRAPSCPISGGSASVS
ncbi:hypothetical protein BHE90_009784 [Fusarium euwallaceae]|uniref:Uncharacterized protein n=2 Tax=Fusarium solani species complex TaxID=232080 RepID=A0A3M2S347_9HYPO|nr:hypothetical protein CDV36_008417 [Fusarium kuroshium]RTE75737.1 hypothetical protein BHE90_009784 [Fusarium euwallaceae]